ncbi:MAG: PatB family C-S lyase [Pseudomonadales bacterium]|nr:PatB family C-S lyase [Pseudomonadales bacterium]
MTFDFDVGLNRRASSSTKWEKFSSDVLPMWVADMDFAAPDFVIAAIRQRLDHPILGYTDQPESLNVAFQNWLQRHYGWKVEADWLVWLPGVVPGLNLACRAHFGRGQRLKVMIPTPVYHPFLDVAQNSGMVEQRVPMAVSNGRWEMDFDRMQAVLDDQTGALLICNPQNPTGRCYSTGELQKLADFVVRNDLLLVSDEIHCNIILEPGCRHQPVAQIDPEIARHTISLFAATKIYNIPGVSCAVAVIPDPNLREQFKEARAGLVSGIGPLGFVASEAAFNDTGQWIPELVAYLRGNYTVLRESLGERLAKLDATYLAWIDVSDLRIVDSEAHFAAHGLGISPGAQFDGPGYVRLNFGCPRSMLKEGIARLERGIAASRV